MKYTETETIDGGNTPDSRPYPEILSNVNKRDFDDFKSDVGEELDTLESRIFNGYTTEKNYTDNVGLYARWYPPEYFTPSDPLMCVSFEVPVTGGTTIKHLLGWHKSGGEVNTIVELDENHNIIDPISRSNLQTDDTEVTATLRPNTKYLLIPCLKSLKATAYVKDNNGSVIWKMLGGDVIKGLLALNETPTFKVYTQEEKNIEFSLNNDYVMTVNIDFPVSKIISINAILTEDIFDFLNLEFPYEYKIINVNDNGYDDLKVYVKNANNGDFPVNIKVVILYTD